MRGVRRLAFASALLLLQGGAAWAGGGPLVQAIEVTGNRRTATGFILQELRLRPGDPYDGDAEALAQRLLNLRLFSSARVVARPVSGDGVVLEVTVADRWTLLPIPMFSSSGSDTSAGLFLLESNLLGWGKTLGVGGQLGGRKKLAFAAYRDPSVAGSRWTAGGSLAWLNVRAERYQGGSLVYTFRNESLSVNADVGLRFTERLRMRLGVFGASADPRAEGGFAAPARLGAVRGVSAAADYLGADFHLFFEDGFTARAELRRALPGQLGGRELESGQLRLAWGAGNRLGHAWSLGLKGDWVDGDPVVDAVRLGGRDGSRGFELDGLWAERSATAALEYQVPLWRRPWGVVTALAFVDAGVVRWRGDTTRYTAPGLGVRVYLAGVAIPALGVDVSESTAVRKPSVSVAVGFQF